MDVGPAELLPSERLTVDIHCVTTWSKLDTVWEGVSLDTLFESVDTAAEFAFVGSYGGYTTNFPVADLLGGKAWIVYGYQGEPLPPVHGGPARLLVPHLYFWKSAKWVRSIELRDSDIPGFWEHLGYHSYGDPWRDTLRRGLTRGRWFETEVAVAGRGWWPQRPRPICAHDPTCRAGLGRPLGWPTHRSQADR